MSADIESLQGRSSGLSRRLDNRQLVEKALNPMMDLLSIPPETISKIAEGTIDETWAKTLAELDKRDAAHKKRASSAESSKASEDIGPLLEKLVQKVGPSRLVVFRILTLTGD